MAEPPTTATQPPGVARVAAWTLREGRRRPTLAEFLEGLVAAVRDEGVPLARAASGASTLHPQFYAMRAVWTPEEGAATVAVTHGERVGVAVGSTPLGRLIEGAPTLRARLQQDGGTMGFSDLEDLRARGFTDWVAHAQHLDGRTVGGMTWSTKHPEGFSDAQLALLEGIHPAVSAIVETYLQRAVMATVLRTYLGADAGERVRRGQIRRGDRQTIRAAIWFSDLRNFTVLSGKLPPDTLIATLNEAFGPMVAAVHAHGGQVLKFIGDGMLAIFPDTPESAAAGGPCAQALQAALAARTAFEATNQSLVAAGREPLDFGLGLHFGDAMYGNIGAPDRLDFTVIGPAVNEASRIESQCKSVGRWLLVSPEFATRCGRPMTSVGPQHLKGIAEPVELFGLTAEAAPK